ncbi:MAG: 5'/3'-nucleotidase SurE [Parachlamydiaceae bacterium]|nr:5'/3'-nucleotidase SurE [Parachlamydiaceae bacterium]
MRKPRILITNDDGVFAPGIRHLWNAVNEMADVTVVAPAFEQSATSLSITVRSPLSIAKADWYSPKGPVWSVSGTPSDCVKLALTVILPEQPDLIISGVNRGNNAGRNVLYSGTVAAVIEGIMHNIPGIAFSLDGEEHSNYDGTEKHIQQIIRYILQHPLPSGTFLNVNFPQHSVDGIKGIRMARQGKEFWVENPECRSHPKGHSYYWLGIKLAKFQEHEDSDISLLEKGFATAVPIHVGELTDIVHVNNHRKIFEEFVN